MFGTTRFQWFWGDNEALNILATTELDLSAADANAGTIKAGKACTFKANSDKLMAYAGIADRWVGFLEQSVNKDGTTSAEGFRDFVTEKYGIPVKRGSNVALRVPKPGYMAEFEGTGAAIVDNLVATSGTGLISSSTAVNTELGFLNGCWRVAQSGDMVHATVLRANLTPQNTGEVRIRVCFVSPYAKS